jgi:hypothetical protein
VRRPINPGGNVASGSSSHSARGLDLAIAKQIVEMHGGRNESLVRPDPTARIFKIEPWDNDDAIDVEDERLCVCRLSVLAVQTEIFRSGRSANECRGNCADCISDDARYGAKRQHLQSGNQPRPVRKQGTTGADAE